MRETTYNVGLGAWIGLPILTFIVAAAAHAGWAFTGWLFR